MYVVEKHKTFEWTELDISFILLHKTEQETADFSPSQTFKKSLAIQTVTSHKVQELDTHLVNSLAQFS